jgi:hypothetical protein
MTRRWFLSLLACLSWFAGGTGRPSASAQDGLNPGPVEKPDLQDTLEKGLKARRPQEFAFVRRVVALVEAGDLPQTLVQSTFLWARKRSRRPFQSFEFALRQRAREELGLNIPPATTTDL